MRTINATGVSKDDTVAAAAEAAMQAPSSGMMRTAAFSLLST